MLPSFTNNKLEDEDYLLRLMGMGDRTSLDKMANACIFPSSSPSSSVKDLGERLIKVCFNFLNMVFSFNENFKKSYYVL